MSTDRWIRITIAFGILVMFATQWYQTHKAKLASDVEADWLTASYNDIIDAMQRKHRDEFEYAHGVYRSQLANRHRSAKIIDAELVQVIAALDQGELELAHFHLREAWLSLGVTQLAPLPAVRPTHVEP